jgi:tetratricopeptide (TPR) repeat protein
MMLRKVYPRDSIQATLERIATHLAGKTPAAEVDAIFAEVQKHTDLPDVARDIDVFVKSAKRLGRKDLARKCLENAARRGGEDAWARLGDFFVGEKLWAQAASCYHRAGEAAPANAAYLFLEGWTLAKHGQEQEGRRLMEQARWLPLADAGARHELVAAMDKLGLTEEAGRQRSLLLRGSEIEDWHAYDVNRTLSRAAVARKDYPTAARHYELCVLWFFRSKGALYLETEAPLWIGHWLHYLRARGFLAGGDIDAALTEARLALTLLAGDIDIPISFVPELKRRGRDGEAVHRSSRSSPSSTICPPPTHAVVGSTI